MPKFWDGPMTPQPPNALYSGTFAGGVLVEGCQAAEPNFVAQHSFENLGHRGLCVAYKILQKLLSGHPDASFSPQVLASELGSF